MRKLTGNQIDCICHAARFPAVQVATTTRTLHYESFAASGTGYNDCTRVITLPRGAGNRILDLLGPPGPRTRTSLQPVVVERS
jgi:hypothetical protein